MLTWTVDPEIEARLEQIGATTEDRKTELLRDAVYAMLDDAEDVRMAEKALENPGKRYTLEEVEQELGLDD